MFWLHGEELPPGVGGERFGAIHLAYLAAFLILTLCYAFFYARLDAARRKTADRILGTAVFFCGLFEYGVTALLGRFGLYSLPIHVCSLLFILSLIHAWTNAAPPGSRAAKLHGFLGAVIFHPGILGAWAALLFPDWLDVPFWNYLSVSGFLAHGFLAVYGASVLVQIAQTPDRTALLLRDLRSSMLFLGVGAAVMYFFDQASGANYWFMAGPGLGSPFTLVYERGGHGAYLAAFLLTAAVVTALWYALRYCFLVRRREKRKPGNRNG